MANHENSLEHFSNLDFVVQFIESKDIPYLLRLSGRFSTGAQVTELMQENFDIEVDLSKACEYFAFNDYKCIFKCDSILRAYGY
ncbi:MAG: hypothetical protein P8I55_05105 [Crocinitomix sp.]|nr:hypothetical protein [Crocinitomix sp.]